MSPDPYHAGADRAGRRVYCSRLRNSPPPLHFTDQPRGSRNPPAFPFSALGWVAVPGRPWPHHLAAQLRGSLNFFALSRFPVSIFFLLLRCATAWLTHLGSKARLVPISGLAPLRPAYVDSARVFLYPRYEKRSGPLPYGLRSAGRACVTRHGRATRACNPHPEAVAGVRSASWGVACRFTASCRAAIRRLRANM